MIKAIIRWLFRKEVEKYIAEATALLDAAAKHGKREYVSYARFNLDSPAFLYAMQPFFNSTAVISWLKDRQEKVYEIIKMGEQANLQNFIGRALAIDAIFKDLEDFQAKYQTMLDDEAEKKAAANA